MINPPPPVREIYRLALTVSTANDWIALAWRTEQLFIAVVIFLFRDILWSKFIGKGHDKFDNVA